MSRWLRTIPFSSDHEQNGVERWEYRRASGPSVAFDVDVRVGKSFNVMGLKGTDIQSIREYAGFLAETAKRLYRSEVVLENRARCPACHDDLCGAQEELRIFDVPYVRCRCCGHVLVANRPRGEAFVKLFEDSEQHASTYVDVDALELRIKEIIAPKLDWCLDSFRRHRGAEPRRVLDVGAGGGHFLAEAVRRGMEVEGFEKSRASRAFAETAFGLSLRDDEFIDSWVAAADLVTFWGLLEYVDNPRDFIRAAKRITGSSGMLVVEVPRADSLGTLVQGMKHAVVARHMDPTSHVNVFSDESLCTALVEEGYAPVSAWYFGMDAYETMVQAQMHVKDDSLMVRMGELLSMLQMAVDRGRQCDDLVVAAVPMRVGEK